MTTEAVGERKTRSDKKTNVNSALDALTHKKLQKLALACSTKRTVSKTALAAWIIQKALNSPSFIDEVQEAFGVEERLIPLTADGRLFL